MPKKKERLTYNYNECCWEDKDGNAVRHDRYSESPASLESRTFMKSYLNAVRKGKTLNEWMRTNQKFSADEVQKAARKMRKAYQVATEAAGHKDSFPLLKKEVKVKEDLLGLEVAGLLVELGIKAENQDGPRHLKEGK